VTGGQTVDPRRLAVKRYTGKELHEHSWFPALWRDQLTDFLSFFNIYSGTYRPALKRMQEILADENMPSVYTDLCAGCGLYDWRFAQHLSRHLGRGLRVRLTDLYPSYRQWKEIAVLSGGMAEPVDTPLSAPEAIRRFEGLHVMFSGLHHFSPEEIEEMIRAAVENRRTLAFFDYSRRTWLLWEALMMLNSLPFMILTAPLVWKFSWKRLFFTWIVPVLPLLLLVDGWLSRLRAYRPDELRRILDDFPFPPGWHAEAGCDPVHAGLAQVTYLIVRPPAAK